MNTERRKKAAERTAWEAERFERRKGRTLGQIYDAELAPDAEAVALAEQWWRSLAANGGVR